MNNITVDILISLITSLSTSGVISFIIKKRIENKIEKDLIDFKNKNKRKENNLSLLNEEQKVILKIFPKIFSNYYSEETLKNKPNNLPKKFEEKYPKLDGGIVSQRIIHGAYEYDVNYGNIFMNSINPVATFNTLMLETATSSDSVCLITYNMNKIYNGYTGLGFENPEIYVYSLLYKYLILDYKQINIPDETLLKFILNDFDKKIDLNNFEVIKKDVGLK